MSHVDRPYRLELYDLDRSSYEQHRLPTLQLALELMLPRALLRAAAGHHLHLNLHHDAALLVRIETNPPTPPPPAAAQAFAVRRRPATEVPS
jgi:hypothetical protein